MTYDYDLFVIGAGSGGLGASKRAASYGARVAIAEADLVGGTCAIRGCIPKKLMVYAAEFSSLYQDAVGYGWSEVQSHFDWQKLTAAVDREVHRLDQVHTRALQAAGVELIKGYAKFVDAHTLEVGERKVTADKILIAVGGKPFRPPVEGIEHAVVSDDMFHLPQQPKHIVIMGGGYIGIEFACIMKGLGSQVTQIIRGDQLLKGFDDDLSTGIREGMRQHGIRVLPHTIVTKIEPVEAGLKLSLSGDYEEPLVADTILCAVGRMPNVQNLGLENMGVEIGQGPGHFGYASDASDDAIAVNEYSQTTQPNIFAVGDCTDRLNLTPVAIAEGRAFADTEFGNQRRAVSHEYVPTAVFSQPEAASVGWTEADAREQFGDPAIKCYRAKFRPLFHSLTGKEEKVMIKLVVDADSDRVLGAHMVGAHAAEIIQGMAIAINMKATKKDFDATMAIHPSTAEEFVTLR